MKKDRATNYPIKIENMARLALLRELSSLRKEIRVHTKGLQKILIDNGQRKDGLSDDLDIWFRELDRITRTSRLSQNSSIFWRRIVKSLSRFGAGNIIEVQAQSAGVQMVPTIALTSAQEEGLAGIASEAAKLITDIPLKLESQIVDVVSSGVSEGLRHEVIAEQISARTGVAASRARLIARDQVSKIYSGIHRNKMKEANILSYIWRTSLDDAVRDSHMEKEGNIYGVDSPPADTGHPGEDINCRCTMEPIVPGLT